MNTYKCLLATEPISEMFNHCHISPQTMLCNAAFTHKYPSLLINCYICEVNDIADFVLDMPKAYVAYTEAICAGEGWQTQQLTNATPIPGHYITITITFISRSHVANFMLYLSGGIDNGYSGKSKAKKLIFCSI